MAESWTKLTGTDDYEVIDSVVVRKVNRAELVERKSRLQDEITRLGDEVTAIDSDIAQIDALEA